MNGEESRITMIEVNNDYCNHYHHNDRDEQLMSMINYQLLGEHLISIINCHKIEVLVSISTMPLVVKQRTEKYFKKLIFNSCK